MKTIKSKSPFFISCIVFIALTPLFAQETSLAEDKEKKNVLVVNSYHPGYDWSDSIMKGIQSVLGDNNFKVHIEYLDSKRYDGEIYYKHLKEILRHKYSDDKIDAMIVSDHNAYNLMLEMRKTFQTDVPLVFCGLDRVYPENITDYQPIYGVIERDGGIGSTLDLILSIHPGIRKIFFIADETTSAGVMLSYVRDFEPLYEEVTFDYLINMSARELKSALKNVPQNSAVMWLHLIRDKNGKIFTVAESRKYVVNNVSVPVYVVSGFNTDTGVLGGSINDGFVQGEKAAQIAQELLNKNIIPDPFYQQVPSTNTFDYKVMKRFNIGINDIPENSVIYNKPISVFENYRWQIVGILIFIGFQTLLISILIINLKKRKTGEKSLLESEERFRATFEQAAVGIAHVSTEGRFLRINRKFCEILGYSIEEMLERTFRAITHPDDLDADVAEVQRLLDGEKTTYSMEKRYIRKDKHNVWVNLTVSLVRDKADAPAWFVSVIDDISERKRAENTRKETEEKFHAVVDQSPIAIQIHGLDGKLITSNAAWRELNAFDDEVLAEVKEKYNILEDEQARELGIMPSIEKVYAGASVEFPLYSYTVFNTLENLDFANSVPMPRTHWIQTRGFPLKDEAGRVTSSVFMSMDITEQKLAEMALQESEERFRHLMEQSPLSIQICDGDGRLVDGNKAWRKLWNISEEDMPFVKANYNILKDEEVEKRGVLPLIKKAFIGEVVHLPDFYYESAVAIDTIGLTEEKAKAVWLRITIYPVFDMQGKVKNVVSIEEDISESRLVQIALKKSESRFRATFEQAAVGIAHVSPDGGFLRINQRFCSILGYTASEMLVLTFQDITHPNDLDADVAEVQRLLNGESETYSLEKRYIRKDKHHVWVNLTVSLVRDEADVPAWFVAVVDDISERKLAENALSESEEKFRHLVEQSPFSIQIFNTDGYLDQVNEAFMKLWGVTEETLPELLGKYNVLEDEEAHRLGIGKEIRRAFNGDLVTLPLIEYDAGSTFTDIGMSREGGHKRWILPRLYPLKNTRGEVVKVVEMEEDITERIYAEEKYRILVEQAQDGITIIRDGKIIFVNPYLAKFQGYTQSEIVGTPFTDYIFPDEMDKVKEIYQLRMAGKPAPTVYESALKSKDGLRLEVEFSAAVIIYEGKPANLVIVRDIAERKRAERELHQYQGRLQSLAAQLTLAEEKERRRIATDLHDQIGQLLASSRFQLAAMINKSDDPALSEKLQNVSGNLRQAVDDTRHIIADLSSPMLEELGLVPAISDWLEENIQNRFDIKTSFSSNSEYIDLEEDVGIMLYRSVRELLTNVIKHARASQVDVIIEVENDLLNITAEDNGAGFDYRPYGPYLQNKNTLGLFSIRERMTDLGGEMVVKSSKSKGTKVRLTVPLRKT